MARYVIVTPDIVGPIKNGGIGTAFTALARHMVSWGHTVTIVYALGQYTETNAIAHWQTHYAQLGITLLALDLTPAQESVSDAPYFRKLAWCVHRWLQQESLRFDVAFFPEWAGLAYYALLARGQSLAYRNLVFVTNTHGPESWAREGNAWLTDSLDLIDRDYMERECVRRADWIISPSRYMLEWMTQHQWLLPRRQRVLQNLIMEPPRLAAHDVAGAPRSLVFFGRLEKRKGLHLFCDALDRLDPELRAQITSVDFLGKSLPGKHDLRPYIRERARKWGVPFTIRTDRDHVSAIQDLLRPGVLAVIPSLMENSPYTVLECLHHGIRFIASAVGGIPELIAPDQHAETLFPTEPIALAALIARQMQEPDRPALMATTQEETKREWRHWLDEAGKSSQYEDIVAIKEQPLVSVCLVCGNDPAPLAEALASLRQQTYEHFEVLLVGEDDPSIEVAALGGLDSEFLERGWRYIGNNGHRAGAGRSTAACLAQGKYVLFMDIDTIAVPMEIARFVTAAEASQADVLTCVSAFAHDDQTPIATKRLRIPLGASAGAGVYGNCFGNGHSFWRREAFLSLGSHPWEDGNDRKDWEVFARAVLAGLQLQVVPETLFWRKRSNRSASSRYDQAAHLSQVLRPYLEYDPQGLGAALAYAAYLELQANNLDLQAKNGEPAKRIWLRASVRVWRVIRMGLANRSLRRRFWSLCREEGCLYALRQAFRVMA